MSYCDKICRDKHGDIYVEVWAYSNANMVNVFVNGEQLGKSQMSQNEDHLEWLVLYTPGVLECRAYDVWGKVVSLR